MADMLTKAALGGAAGGLIMSQTGAAGGSFSFGLPFVGGSYPVSVVATGVAFGAASTFVVDAILKLSFMGVSKENSHYHAMTAATHLAAAALSWAAFYKFVVNRQIPATGKDLFDFGLLGAGAEMLSQAVYVQFFTQGELVEDFANVLY